MRVRLIALSIAVGAVVVLGAGAAFATQTSGDAGGGSGSDGMTGGTVFLWDVERPVEYPWTSSALSGRWCGPLFRNLTPEQRANRELGVKERTALLRCANAVAGVPQNKLARPSLSDQLAPGRRANIQGERDTFGFGGNTITWKSFLKKCTESTCNPNELHPDAPPVGASAPGKIATSGVAIAGNFVLWRFDPFASSHPDAPIFVRAMPGKGRDGAENLSDAQWWRGGTTNYWDDNVRVAGPLGPLPLSRRDIRTDEPARSKTASSCLSTWNAFKGTSTWTALYPKPGAEPRSITHFVAPALRNKSNVISCMWKMPNTPMPDGEPVPNSKAVWIALSWFFQTSDGGAHRIYWKAVGQKGDILTAYSMAVDSREGPRSWGFSSGFSPNTFQDDDPCVVRGPDLNSLGVPGGGNPYMRNNEPFTGTYVRESDGKGFAVTKGYFEGLWPSAGCRTDDDVAEPFTELPPTSNMSLDPTYTVIAGRRSPDANEAFFSSSPSGLAAGQAIWPRFTTTWLFDPQAFKGRVTPLRQVGTAGGDAQKVSGDNFYRGAGALIRSRDNFPAQRKLSAPRFSRGVDDLEEVRDVLPAPALATPETAGELAVYSTQQALVALRDPGEGEDLNHPMWDASGPLATPRSWFDSWLVPSRDKNSPAKLSAWGEYETGGMSWWEPPDTTTKWVPAVYSISKSCASGDPNGKMCLGSSGDLRRWDSDGRLGLAATSAPQLVGVKQNLIQPDSQQNNYFHAELTSNLPAGAIKSLSLYTNDGTPWDRVTQPITNRENRQTNGRTSGWHIYRCRSGYDEYALVARGSEFKYPAGLRQDGSEYPASERRARGAQIADPGCEAPYFSWEWEKSGWSVYDAGSGGCTENPNTVSAMAEQDYWMRNLAPGARESDRQDGDRYRELFGGDPQVRGATPWNADETSRRCWIRYPANVSGDERNGYMRAAWYYPGLEVSSSPQGIKWPGFTSSAWGYSTPGPTGSWDRTTWLSAWTDSDFAGNPDTRCTTNDPPWASPQSFSPDFLNGRLPPAVGYGSYPLYGDDPCSGVRSWSSPVSAGGDGVCPKGKYMNRAQYHSGPNHPTDPSEPNGTCWTWTKARSTAHFYRNTPIFDWFPTLSRERVDGRSPAALGASYPSDGIGDGPQNPFCSTSQQWDSLDSFPDPPRWGDKGTGADEDFPGRWEWQGVLQWYKVRPGTASLPPGFARPGGARQCDYYVPGWKTKYAGRWTGGLEDSRKGPGFETLAQSNARKRIEPGAYWVMAEIEAPKSVAAGGRWRIDTDQMNPKGSFWTWEVKQTPDLEPAKIYSLGAQPTN